MQRYASVCFIRPGLCLSDSATFTASQWALEANHTHINAHIHPAWHIRTEVILPWHAGGNQCHITQCAAYPTTLQMRSIKWSVLLSYMVPRLLFPSFPITPPPSCCQAEEVCLSRHLIRLVLSLALWPQSDPQIHAPRIDFMSAAAWQWCTDRPPLFWFFFKKLTGHRNDKIQWAAGWQVGLMAFDMVFLHCFEKSTHTAGSLSAMMNWSRAASICEGQEILSAHCYCISSDIFLYYYISTEYQMVNITTTLFNKTISPQGPFDHVTLLLRNCLYKMSYPFCLVKIMIPRSI